MVLRHLLYLNNLNRYMCVCELTGFAQIYLHSIPYKELMNTLKNCVAIYHSLTNNLYNRFA